MSEPTNITRRDTLKGAVALGVAGIAAGAASPEAAAAKDAATAASTSNLQWQNPQLIAHTKSAKMLINKERAYQIMDKYGLNGLVASTRKNIYYISSHGGIMQWMGRHFTTYAFFPRREDAQAALIIPGAMLYHLDYRPTWVPSVIPYTAPKAVSREAAAAALAGASSNAVALPRNEHGEIEAIASPRGWQVRQGVEYDQRDRTLMALFAEYEGKTSASALQGLRRAIREGGAAKGKIGFDDPRVLNWLQADGLSSLKGVDAGDIFKEIRMVKTQNEIDLLREAASRNEAALDYAIAQIAPGYPLEEIELAHARKWGELQGRGRWLIANIHCLNSGVCAKGDFMKLDSVGVYKGYNGNVGRTVVIGQPTDELAKRIEANTKASKIVYAAIKPGMKFREASHMWVDLMRQEGVMTGFAGPHNVGIDHTDEPFPNGVLVPGGFDGNYNFTFEDGTVFTLDMPYGEIGWGTTHVEDMIAIRKNGFEYLSSGDTSLRIRPA